MARASGACHVAEITRTDGGRHYRYSLLRRTYREAGTVKHETRGNLSRLPAATIALIRRAGRGDALVAPDDAWRPGVCQGRHERGNQHRNPAGSLCQVRRTLREVRD